MSLLNAAVVIRSSRSPAARIIQKNEPLLSLALLKFQMPSGKYQSPQRLTIK